MTNRKSRIGIWLLVAMLLTAVLLGGCAQDTGRKGKGDEEDGKELGFASGAGTEESPYIITSEAQLRAIDALEKTDGLYFALGNDIPLVGAENPWTPIEFSGHLDGRGFAISNLYISSAEHEAAGLFSRMSNGSIKDLTMRNATIVSTCAKDGLLKAVGSLVGVAWAHDSITITNCHAVDVYVSGTSKSFVGGLIGYGESITVDGCTTTVTADAPAQHGVVSTGEDAGGIAGWLLHSTVSNCQNGLPVTFADSIAGGIVGMMTSTTVTNCSNSGRIYGRDIGGIAGWAHLDSTLSGCTNSGEIVTSDWTADAGGIVGYIHPDEKNAVIRDCSNSGAITGEGVLGGIAGKVGKFAQFSQVSNTGTITGGLDMKSIVGGIAGECIFTKTTIENASNTAALSGRVVGGIVGDGDGTASHCQNSGRITAELTGGGIFGNSSSADAVLTDCTNTADVSGREAGGIVGNGGGALTGCENAGNVTGITYTGGIIGYVGYHAAITSCTNSGAVSGEEYAGGLVTVIPGISFDGTIVDSTNTGTVTGGKNNP